MYDLKFPQFWQPISAVTEKVYTSSPVDLWVALPNGEECRFVGCYHDIDGRWTNVVTTPVSTYNGYAANIGHHHVVIGDPVPGTPTHWMWPAPPIARSIAHSEKFDDADAAFDLSLSKRFSAAIDQAEAILRQEMQALNKIAEAHEEKREREEVS